MTNRRVAIGLVAAGCLAVWVPIVSAQETLFAVVTAISKDRKQATAQVVAGGAVSEATLIPTDAVLDNLIWKKIEICHSVRADAEKVGDGYRLLSIKQLDAGMLPMPLQGVAGDCLLKKALEFAPLVD
ncbi:MAG TPA: hypothetical protein VJ692_09925 [Nitrospiraceae bacterium]|nr:hypothetical protein [Nitrospiraceae bacterium]